MNLTIELTDAQANAWIKQYGSRTQGKWEHDSHGFNLDGVRIAVRDAIIAARPEPIKVWDKVLFANRHPRIVHAFGLDARGGRWMAVSEEYSGTVYVVYPHDDYTMANGQPIQWPA